VLRESVAAIAGELGVAVSATESAKVVEAKLIVTEAVPPLFTKTDVDEGVIVYPGFATPGAPLVRATTSV
jgi:hypothetical protein